MRNKFLFKGRLLSMVHICAKIFSDLKDLSYLKFKGNITSGQDWPGFFGMVAGLKREYKTLVVR